MPPIKDFASKLDEMLTGLYPADKPGAAVIVVRGGKVLFRKGYGMANLELGSSGTFDWTAPSPAVGPVKLYLAGHQGLAGGPNTEVTMIAQGAGISEAGAAEPRRAALRIEPTVVANRLVLCISNPSSPARLRITDRTGRVVYRLALTASAESHVVSWSVAGLAAGTYLATLDCAGEHIARKFTVR